MRLRVSALLLLSGAFIACGDDDPVAPSTSLGSITAVPSSSTVAAGATATVALTAKDRAGTAISDATGYVFSSSAPTIADVSSNGRLLGVGAGSATITVSLTRAGVTRTASFPVTVTGTLGSALTVVAGAASNDYTPREAVVARNGTVTWTSGARPHNVIFNVTDGAPANVPTGTNLNVSRTFAARGDFIYQCTIHPGMTAAVFVR